MKLSLGTKSVLFVMLILFLDQVLKIWIKTHFVVGQELHFLGKYGMIHFIENNGMAFGMEMGGKPGKLILSIFRLLAIGAIGWYLSELVKKKANTGLILAVSAIMAGAIGNIIDSAFYGMIFSQSTYEQVAVLFPQGGGYAPFLHGKVVDMFYFPVISTHWPAWSPYRAGESLVFFRPVFNLSDSAITCGVISILIFQKRMFKDSVNTLGEPETE
ncbi:MAG TPA: lipoprotein signal peptidase [Bacteroidales bacterium]|nr:lipoprotein signal peptidase [Bacteroidales bacterium]